LSVKIKDVKKDSVSYGKIYPGETLISINEKNIEDVLDYMYQCADDNLRIVVSNGDKQRTIVINKDEYEDLGLEFETFLMDKQHRCSNKCVFCFIDQLPKGMRETLYFKDDDARMSFLMGNYITLTNLTEDDINRIISQKISPINISVHTTNPELRVKMLRNPRAAFCLDIIKRFAEANIKMNCQIVVCKSLNDGEELKRTLNDLIGLYPAVNSISVVPVGITKHREGLYPLKMIEKNDALDIIKLVEDIAKEAKNKLGTRVAFLADEFFLRAGMEIPEPEYYEDYPQIENGVGLIASLKEEFDSLMPFLPKKIKKRNVTIVTGMAALSFISSLVDLLKRKCNNLKCNVIGVKNEFFGETVDVAGLVVGSDIIKNLRENDIGDEILIPAQMLRYDRDKFLDDVLVSDIENIFNKKVRIVENTGEDFIKGVLGIQI